MRKRLSASRRYADHPHEGHPSTATRRTNRRALLIAATMGLAFTGGGILLQNVLQPAPRLIWNASASAPVGLYALAPFTPIRTGDMVVARLPVGIAMLAAKRRYLPIGVPLVKRVGAVPGDRICAIGAMVTINGRPVATRLPRDRSDRPLPWWRGCTTLRDGRIFLLSPVHDAFDSRYFGPVEASAIIGRAAPLWTDPAKDSRDD
ncbi:conjugative transfer signal peptidase TraF [Sphingomonas sp. SORGH_AS 950]|uniref:S26 family signal peptidase n=1 Tax=Sphingomonas sp. SORGH_AS_0950 TaxID=3041792 RepID=UPI00277DC292|nr:S26 family signal peptidase [Sphingomonas sp. SORGH_AS_0950]MDQ1158917.1 conjugative transfer signal peptidase TraF [Sphingomonas sp. SORGH_AS_0950]